MTEAAIATQWVPPTWDEVVREHADRVYQLEVIPEPGITRLIIRDTTKPKVVPGLSDAERWRQAGLTPQGRPLDPKAFE